MTFARKPPHPRRERDPGEFASHTTRPITTARMVTAQDVYLPSAAAPKTGRFDSKAWRRAVASLPCVLCGKEGETQCAHRNEGKAMSLRTDDCFTAALCIACHFGIDQGSQHTRAERRERMDRAILLTYRALAMAGRLVAV